MEAELRRRLIRTGAPLLVLALASALLIAAAHKATGDRIEDSRRSHTLSIVRDAMPLEFDNDLLRDVTEVTEPAYLGTDQPVSVFRARHGETPVGVVLMPVVAGGYNGRIELAVGIAYDGTITGVRVGRHAETEGLGDQVHQSRSRWILGFTGRSLGGTDPAAWAVASDGGEFDQISGATITPRGVIRAVKSALEYHDLNRDRLYAKD